jgi:hypothetical protein
VGGEIQDLFDGGQIVDQGRSVIDDVWGHGCVERCVYVFAQRVRVSGAHAVQVLGSDQRPNERSQGANLTHQHKFSFSSPLEGPRRIVLVRLLVDRRSESGLLAEIHRDLPGWVPKLPHHSDFNRRARWLWGAFEQVRVELADQLPADDWGQVGTSARRRARPRLVRYS